MDLNNVLVILGSFISLLLMVNAYFTRETLIRVVRLEIEIKTNATKQSYIEKQTQENSYEIKQLREFKSKYEFDYENMVKIINKIKE